MKKRVFIGLSIVTVLVIVLFLVRMFSERQLDDVSPEIPCEKELLENADVLYVIPKFNNKSIAENEEWCEYILSLNKTLAIHGVYHIHNEFLEDRNEQYLEQGIVAFEECFQKSPEKFKPPQLKVSKKSRAVIIERMRLDLYLNGIFHKVYHCNDTGKFSNNFIDWV